MANQSTNKNTGSNPVSFPGPTLNAPHPGWFYDNLQGVLDDSAAKIIPGPRQRNGTRFVDSLTFWNIRPLSSENNPIMIRLRLVTVPDDVYTSANEFPSNYLGFPSEDVDCISLCDCETLRYCHIYPMYIKGDQFLVAYASEPDVVRYVAMYREGV